MGIGWLRTGAAAAAVGAVAVLIASPARADDGWVAVANSPNREEQDWGFGPDQATAELNALTQCAVLERATDCRVLAVSTGCVATAWDVSEPLNKIYAGSGGGPEAAARGAIAAAGPYANDLQVRCTWWPRTPAPPAPPPPGLAPPPGVPAPGVPAPGIPAPGIALAAGSGTPGAARVSPGSV